MNYIGKYTVYDWALPPYSFWRRTFCCGGIYMGEIRIGIVPGNPDVTYLLFSFIESIKYNYISMYGSDPKMFHSIDEAKEHVDIFLDKLQKLKVFL